jgi:hypothetical protein
LLVSKNASSGNVGMIALRYAGAAADTADTALKPLTISFGIQISGEA